MTQKYDRFNLEAEIMNVWNTKDDLQSITGRMMDDPDGPLTEDELTNVLIGLSELHDIRCRNCLMFSKRWLGRGNLLKWKKSLQASAYENSGVA